MMSPGAEMDLMDNMKKQSTMQAAVLTEYGNIQWKTVPLPKIGNAQVLVKVSYAGICGTDLHIFEGEFHPRTRIPFIPGHEFTGSVVAAGEDVEKVRAGDRVAADPLIWCGECPACRRGHYPACASLRLLGIDLDGGFGQYVAVDENMLYPLDSNIPDTHAALIEMLSIGFHACRRSRLEPGDRVAIWGAGRVGQSILQAAKVKTQGEIFMVDVLDERLRIATATVPGITTIHAVKDDPTTVILDRTSGCGVDVAFEAVGHPVQIPDRYHPVRQCIRSVCAGGRVCVLGLADDPAPVVMKELIWKEGTILTSRVTQGEFKDTIENLAKGNLNPDPLISDIVPASKVQEAFNHLRNNPEKYLKILLDLSS